jgi:hypothetical protein
MKRKKESKMVKYPDIEVEISGIDGNAFSIMGTVQKALRRAGVSKEEQDQYFEEATSGDYDNVISTTMKWVSIS